MPDLNSPGLEGKRVIDVDLGDELDVLGVVKGSELEETDAGEGHGVREERRAAVAAEVAVDDVS